MSTSRILVQISGGTAIVEVAIDEAGLRKLAGAAAASKAGAAKAGPASAKIVGYQDVTETIAQAIEKQGEDVTQVVCEELVEKARSLPAGRAPSLGINDLDEVVAACRAWRLAREKVAGA